MKYILSIGSAIGVIVILMVCIFTGSPAAEVDYLRIHIRANSNSVEDQSVKYMVKDAVVEALIPFLSEVHTKEEAEAVVISKFSYIESVANAVLQSEGFSYQAHAKLDNEYFPTRTYEDEYTDLTLAEGYYDAVILELGAAAGNNWWCVVYPAFCFVNSKNSDNIVYISKIWEILKSITQK